MTAACTRQVDYLELWGQVVDAFREVCDAFPDIKVSLEFKATDENTRFFIVPSTGESARGKEGERGGGLWGREGGRD